MTKMKMLVTIGSKVIGRFDYDDMTGIAEKLGRTDQERQELVASSTDIFDVLNTVKDMGITDEPYTVECLNDDGSDPSLEYKIVGVLLALGDPGTKEPWIYFDANVDLGLELYKVAKVLDIEGGGTVKWEDESLFVATKFADEYTEKKIGRQRLWLPDLMKTNVLSDTLNWDNIVEKWLQMANK